ncbi:MAG: dihydrodipicolinate synthase family protein [Planctomycetaceae bacterium]
MQLPEWRKRLNEGVVIPACPLVLDRSRKLDGPGQQRLINYYLQSGAGGIAVGVHTTQFEIRKPEHNLLRPVLSLAARAISDFESSENPAIVRIAGVCGRTAQACDEASLAAELGYHAGLLSLGAMAQSTDDKLLEHCERVGQIIPLFGFYLQPAVGGRILSYEFWRRFAELPSLVAIKIAPFNRYQTLDVVRAVVEAGRSDVALYTGNDDNILIDLLTPFEFEFDGMKVRRHLVGGLLGQWAVGTGRAVQLLRECRQIISGQQTLTTRWLCRNAALTDFNAALFDAANQFRGCISGIHYVLKRQGLMQETCCLDPEERLSPGQAEEIERVCKGYPELLDPEVLPVPDRNERC